MKGKISKSGYRKDSPDRKNDFNVIPSNIISMSNVAFPVFGISDTGESRLMMPGEEHTFEKASKVFEIPVKDAKKDFYPFFMQMGGVPKAQEGLEVKTPQNIKTLKRPGDVNKAEQNIAAQYNLEGLPPLTERRAWNTYLDWVESKGYKQGSDSLLSLNKGTNRFGELSSQYNTENVDQLKAEYARVSKLPGANKALTEQQYLQSRTITPQMMMNAQKVYGQQTSKDQWFGSETARTFYPDIEGLGPGYENVNDAAVKQKIATATGKLAPVQVFDYKTKKPVPYQGVVPITGYGPKGSPQYDWGKVQPFKQELAPNVYYDPAALPVDRKQYYQSFLPQQQKGGEIEKQKEWLNNYLQSPKYKERLGKEFEGKSDAFINSELQKRLNNLNTVGIHERDVVGKKAGMIAGIYMPKKGEPFEKYLYTDKMIGNEGYKNYKQNNIYLEKGPLGYKYPGYETTPVHEMGHAVDEAGRRIPVKTRNLIEKNTKSDGFGDTIQDTKTGNKYGYYDTPTEFINRMQPVRYLLQSEGIYDAGKQDFNDKVFDKMMKSGKIKDNSHFQDIMKTLSGKTEAEKRKQFIMLMNSIASVDNTGSNLYAQKGGTIDKNLFENFIKPHFETESKDVAPQGQDTNTFIQNKRDYFLDCLKKNVSKHVMSDTAKEISDYMNCGGMYKAQDGMQVNLIDPNDPLKNPNAQTNSLFVDPNMSGPFGQQTNTNPVYPEAYTYLNTAANNNPTFYTDPKQEGTRSTLNLTPGADANKIAYQKYLDENNRKATNAQNLSNGADLAMAGMNIFSNAAEFQQNKNYQNKLRDQMSAENIFSNIKGSRGDYDMNSGAFRPNNMTVPSYKRGGQYSVDEKELSRLKSLGYQFEIIE